MKIFLHSILLILALNTQAAPSPEACHTVNIGVVDWTDLHVANGIAEQLLIRLGYEVNLNEQPSMPEIFARMGDAQVDVFLGYWTPAMSSTARPYFANDTVVLLTDNLQNARWTLAVPTYLYDEGLQNFADIVRFGPQLENRIYGLEKGSSGNAAILDMINKNAFGLKDFKLIETSERLMLAQLRGRSRRKEAVVILGWLPHPMNQNYDIRYLAGGDDYFGPDYGHATVNTTARREFVDQCPNLKRFFTNLTFTAPMEESIMDHTTNGFVPVDRAVRMWMHDNPQQVKDWLQGITDINGRKPDVDALIAGMELTMSE
ncbi:MAG: glycine/betaine ABC transporter substrate-binding protein [Oceanospirillaceae bacterium]|nr:glycine/betaine ABC transporter substrate-binding protein [Oceanospirillaceae bacterium]MBT11879.1 glycine/betaine ABC transporter substrate-binding protein [Oceanospirillaceae bacterium]